MSSKTESVLKKMLAAYELHTQEGKTSAQGVDRIITAMMEAAPAERVTLMDMFETKAKELANA